MALGLIRKMIIWTGLLSVSLAAISYLIMIQPPSNLQPKAPNLPAVNVTRDPASTTPNLSISTTALDNKTQSQAVEITLHCQHNDKIVLNPQVRQVRLSGEYCTTGRMPAAVSSPTSAIINRQNKFMATVFYPSTNSYTTDYISLEPGANQISVTHKFKDGSEEEHVYVFERLATAQDPQ